MDINITAVIAELTKDRIRLDRAIAALRALDGEAEATPAPQPAKPVERPARAYAGKVALTPDNVLGLVTTEGVPAPVIRARIKASDGQVLKTLKQLEADGAVTRSGNRRSTRWHAAA